MNHSQILACVPEEEEGVMDVLVDLIDWFIASADCSQHLYDHAL
jgi:hypothetical protein